MYAYRNAAEALVGLTAEIMRTGDVVHPRGMETTELRDVTIKIDDPTDVLLYDTHRSGYHPMIGAVEGLLLLAGVSDPAMMAKVSRAFATFTDGGALHGSYGPRLRPQFQFVVDRLVNDHDTRQAVALIWDAQYDLTDAGNTPRDLPCTIYLLFRVRNGLLEMKTHMRSNDLWRGFCYDVIQFTLLQCTMANLLRLPVGTYTHHADSLHLYAEHRELALKVTPRRGDITPVQLFGLPAPSDETRWGDVRQRAHDLLYADTCIPRSTTEAWLLNMVNRVRN